MFRIRRTVQIFVVLHFTTSLLFSFVGGIIVNVSENIKIDTFLAQLTLSHFPDCALFFFRQENVGNLLGENVLTEMLTQLGGTVSYYNVLYTPSLKQKVSSTDSSHRLFPISVNNYNRKAPVCKLPILIVEDLREEFLLQIKRLKNKLIFTFIAKLVETSYTILYNTIRPTLFVRQIETLSNHYRIRHYHIEYYR
jgi:hypothetical protein